MASVGGISCDIVRPNSPTAKKQRVKTWFVAGLTGIGAHKLGFNEAEFAFELVFFGIDSACDAWALSIDALQGTVVTVIDDFTDTYTQCLITGISNKQKSPALHAKSLGTSGVRCTMTISGEYT